MKAIGILVMVYGAVGLLAPFMGYRFEYNEWMRQWGLLGEWIVPAAIFIIGTVIYGIGAQSATRR